jgi:hypothetical protein
MFTYLSKNILVRENKHSLHNKKMFDYKKVTFFKDLMYIKCSNVVEKGVHLYRP